MPYIDLRINFDTEYDEDEDYTDYSVSNVILQETDLKDEDLESIAETAAQSDTWQVGVKNALFEVIDPACENTIEASNFDF
ncbi:hypothetical protein [Actinomyces vulturis]|uniref:hypothetical protein n=1 Tax=Actinomyces vulturis TaxID=1857645 RepID=UPI0008378FEC|nr:hypothetical protein [Actinomyces vulturis]